jgi:hypothetical protein
MAPKPKQGGTPPTTTVPPGPQPSTTVPAGTLDIAGLIAAAEAMGFGNSDSKLDVLGLTGAIKVDRTTGRVIKDSYTGPTKTIGGQEIQPQYFEGDEYDISTLDAEQVITMQRELQAGGYFLGESFNPGIVRDSTIKAYKRALEDANQSFVSYTDVIKRSKTIPFSGGAGALKKYKVTASPDLESVFDKVSQSVLGRQLDTEQLNKLVETYQSTELQSQKAPAGVSAQAPSAQAFAQQKIEVGNQDEADAFQFAQYAQTLERMLGG